MIYNVFVFLSAAEPREERSDFPFSESTHKIFSDKKTLGKVDAGLSRRMFTSVIPFKSCRDIPFIKNPSTLLNKVA